MDQDLKKQLSQDPDGLLTYEYIANHIGLCDDIMPRVSTPLSALRSRKTATACIWQIWWRAFMVQTMC